MPSALNIFKKHTYLELFLAVLCAVVAAALVGVWLRGLSTQADIVEVVALSHPVTAPAKLVPADLILIKITRGLVPQGSFEHVSDVAGLVLIRSGVANQVMLNPDFIRERDPDSDTILVPGGKIGLLIPASWLATPLPKIAKNDTVTILAAVSGSGVPIGNQGTLLGHAPVLAVRGDNERGPDSVLIGASPAVAAALLQARANTYLLIVVADSAFETPTTTPNATSTVSNTPPLPKLQPRPAPQPLTQ